jgi:hypothetical protein
MAEEILLPEHPVTVDRYALRKEIGALQLIASKNGRALAGSLIRLPGGAELDGFGVSFGTRSLLVRFDGCFYIVFQQDLDGAQKFDCAMASSSVT